MIDVDTMREAIEEMGQLQRECRLDVGKSGPEDPPAIEVFNARMDLENDALTYAIIETLGTTDLTQLISPAAQGLATGIQLGIFAARKEKSP